MKVLVDYFPGRRAPWGEILVMDPISQMLLSEQPSVVSEECFLPVLALTRKCRTAVMINLRGGNIGRIVARCAQPVAKIGILEIKTIMVVEEPNFLGRLETDDGAGQLAKIGFIPDQITAWLREIMKECEVLQVPGDTIDNPPDANGSVSGTGSARRSPSLDLPAWRPAIAEPRRFET